MTNGISCLAAMRRPVGARGVLYAAMLAATSAASAQDSDADGRAEVILPQTLEVIDHLDFGPLVDQGSGGTVVIDPASNLVTSGGTVITVGTSAHRATFRSQWPTGTVLFFTGDTNVTLTRQGGTEQMNAMLTYARGAGLTSGPILTSVRASALEQFYHAGGILFVAAGQAPGLYEGTFTFSIDNI